MPANTSPGKTLRRNSTSELVGSYPFGSSARRALRTQILPGQYGTHPAVRWNRDKFRSGTRWSMSGGGASAQVKFTAEVTAFGVSGLPLTSSRLQCPPELAREITCKVPYRASRLHPESLQPTALKFSA